jgi:UDP-N-acetylglucosamine 2-epimerase (non-hydrolysing)
MYKILTLVGTRPELIKLSSIIPLFDKNFKHLLVHSGQNYDYNLNKIFFKDLQIRKPDYFLNVKSDILAIQISNIIKKTDEILEKTKPDALLVYGDTNTSLGIIVAKRKKIPIFHMEAGNRCFDQRVPEELNRKIADHLSDINITISKQAKEYLISEGLKPEFVFQLGSPMREVIDKNLNNIEKSKIIEKLNLKKKNYIIVSLHREENVDRFEILKNIIDQLILISNKLKIKVIISTHPRTFANIKKFKININTKKNLIFSKPFGFFDYCKLQINSYCTISDSGTIFEEASILNFPAITIRASHERPEGIESGTVVISSDKNKDIFNSIKIARNLKKNSSKFGYVDAYHMHDVSKKMVNLVESYISIVNKKIWYK